jgi:hypothetical protein
MTYRAFKLIHKLYRCKNYAELEVLIAVAMKLSVPGVVPCSRIAFQRPSASRGFRENGDFWFFFIAWLSIALEDGGRTFPRNVRSDSARLDVSARNIMLLTSKPVVMETFDVHII